MNVEFPLNKSLWTILTGLHFVGEASDSLYPSDSDLVGRAVLLSQFSELLLLRDKQGRLGLGGADRRLITDVGTCLLVSLYTSLFSLQLFIVFCAVTYIG